MTNERYFDEIAKLKSANAEAEVTLKGYTDGGIKMVTEEEVQQVKTDYNNYQKHWRVRRRACFEIVDMICDSVDQNRKEFMEKVGLETDEEYNVTIGDFPAEAKL